MSLNDAEWGFCPGCSTLIALRHVVSLKRGILPHRIIPPHKWEQRQNCSPRCKMPVPYDEDQAYIDALKFTEKLSGLDKIMTAFVVNANNMNETKASC